MSLAALPTAARTIPIQARSRRRYDAILAATVEVLREGGLVACTMAAVAAAAGMTPPSLYRYFPNVEALLYAVAQTQLDEINDHLDRGLRDLHDRDEARAALIEGLDGYEQLFREDAAMRAIWAGTLALPSLADLNIADSRRNAALLEERLAPFRTTPLPPGRAFLTAHLMGSGMLLLRHLDNEAAAVRAEVRELMLRLLDD